MSGDSFDYLYEKLDGDEVLSQWTFELMARMAEWLKEPEQNQPQAAAEIMRIHAELQKINERIRGIAQNQPFLDLVKEAEWWCSNDTGKDDFEKQWQKYKEQMLPNIDHPDFMKNHLTMESKIAYLASGEGIHIRFDLDNAEKPKWILTLDDGKEIIITLESLDLEPALNEAIDYTNEEVEKLVKSFEEREREA